MNRIGLALVLVIGGAGCPSIDNDGTEGNIGPTVEFDPSASIVPFPNNLVMDPATRKVNLPEQCNETAAQTAVRVGMLNQLDGFGTFKVALQFTLTEPADQATMTPDNIKLYRRAAGTTPDDPATAQEVPIVVFPGQTDRFVDGCAAAPTPIDAITIVPTVALTESSTYSVAVLGGLHTTTDAPFEPSFTWAFVRQTEDPVIVEGGQIVAERTPLDPTDPADAATLMGVDLLWKAHKGALDFLTAATGESRDNILLAWEFTTQTTTRTLDPTSTGSPASAIGDNPLIGMNRVDGGDAEAFLIARLGASACTALGCSSVGAVMGGLMSTTNYQTDTPNPSGGPPIPGAWSDPVNPTQVGDAQLLQVVAWIPATPPPPTGYPTVVYGHGLGSSKESVVVLAPALSRGGFAGAAVDFVAHGSRAIRTSNDAAIGCGGAPQPTASPQCFAPIFSSNLAGTRDNARQTVLDLMTLIKSAKACTTGCSLLEVDPDRLGYIGISLGGIIGSMTIASSVDLQAGVTNVAGAGLIDVIENTQTLQIKCALVDSLIDAMVVMGPKWNLGMNMVDAACLTDGWKSQPAYVRFASIARWILDSGDPANFAAKLATRVTLLQEVIGDKVVPNIATDQLGALSGRAPVAADPAIPPGPYPPSAAITTNPLTSKWVTYSNLPPDAATGFPGNSFHHATLLRPNEDGTMPPTNAESLGTVRMQTDAVTYLALNIIVN